MGQALGQIYPTRDAQARVQGAHWWLRADRETFSAGRRVPAPT